MLCERVLAEAGVLGDVRLNEYHLDLIPLETDVLSLELPNAFRENFLDSDISSLYYVARSLFTLQSMFGLIPQILVKGDRADMVRTLLARMRAEAPADHFASVVPEIQTLILMDRTVDMVTPMVTQHTYEGQLDEVLGIQNSFIEVDAAMVPQKIPSLNAPNDRKKVPLNSSDPLFSELRDLNFRNVGPLLHRKAAEIRATYSKKDTANTVTQLNDFMKEFKSANQEHNYLSLHIAIAEQVSQVRRSTKFDRRIETENSLLFNRDECEEYIEAAISRMEPLIKVLRLLCLLSLTYGIKQKRFDFLKREILQTYGFETIFTLNNLEKMGLLRSNVKSNWPILSKALRLCQEIDDASMRAAPNDLSYTYAGYAPLSARLVEMAVVNNGWSRIDPKLLELIPGRTNEMKQELPLAIQDRARLQATDQNKKPIVLVYFIGGVTFSEISAIRFLGSKENIQRDFVVATTRLINGDSLLNSLVEDVENRLNRSTISQ